MADISGGSSSSKPFESQDSVADQTRAQREPYLTNERGDAVGNNYLVPKSDFAKFLGYAPPTQAEAEGKKPLSGARVVELALEKEMQDLGRGAAKNGNAYRNIYISWGRFNNEPGNERAMLKDARDAFQQGPDKNSIEDHVRRMGPTVAPYFQQLSRIQTESRSDNIRYLEMQYKFQEMSKQEGTISNLMKTRHDAVTRTIRGNQGA